MSLRMLVRFSIICGLPIALNNSDMLQYSQHSPNVVRLSRVATWDFLFNGFLFKCYLAIM